MVQEDRDPRNRIKYKLRDEREVVKKLWYLLRGCLVYYTTGDGIVSTIYKSKISRSTLNTHRIRS